MSQIERMHPDCPPDAHKVMRPPENPLNAQLCVFVTKEEVETCGIDDVLEVLALMNQKPLLLCEDDSVRQQIKDHCAKAELTPAFIRVNGDGTCTIEYLDGAVSSSLPFYAYADDYHNFEHFLDKLSEKCVISVDTLSMLILRSISTVYPWDKLLAGDFIRQYIKASDAISDEDRDLLRQIRYGKYDPMNAKDTKAYQFLRLERKLFLQYPSEDD